jgi:CRISPR system Cascade subunit CasB
MSNSYLRFDKDSPESQALISWWRLLDEKRGDRAELRRCGTLAEVVFTPAYHRLRQAVCRYGAIHEDGLAAMAGLAAKVKTNVAENSIAEQMASGKGDSARARVSGLRFRRLLKAKDQEELFTSMGRVIALLDESVNLLSMAQSVYFWNDRTRKQWAFDYYSKAPSEN